MIRNIIWDLDGTLFDTYPAILGAFQRAVKELGVDIAPQEIMHQARRSLTNFADVLVEKYDLDPLELSRRYLLYYDDYPLEMQPPFPGVRDICEYIQSAGGVNVIVTHRRWSSAKKLLQAYKMSVYFAGLYTIEEGYPLKPDPTMFEKVINLYRLQRKNTLAVGDRDIDVRAGKSAGIKTCLYSSNSSEAAPDLIIQDYGELLEKLKQSGNWS